MTDPLERLYIDNPTTVGCRRGCGQTIRAETPRLAEKMRDDHESVCQQTNPLGFCPTCGRPA